jgi:hypothetical protein
MTPTQTLLVTFAVTIIGSGLGTSIVAALLNKRFGTQLEAHKALLLRSGRIHERQVDALLKINSKLDEALFYLQRVASAGKMGEASDKELFGRTVGCLADAWSEFSKNRLLISDPLEQRLDEFFHGMVVAGIDFNLILDPMVTNPDERAKLWDALRDAAYRKLPSVLKAIRDDARAVIHG